jgi:hypothetical protein
MNAWILILTYLLPFVLIVYLGNAIGAVVTERSWRAHIRAMYGARITTPMWKIFLTVGCCERVSERLRRTLEPEEDS